MESVDKMMNWWFIFLAVCSTWKASEACTAIGITSGATVDRSTLLAHTDDAGGEAGDVRVERLST